jgi:hypothetical protein
MYFQSMKSVKHMLQSPLTGQFKEKPTSRVRFLIVHSSMVWGHILQNPSTAWILRVAWIFLVFNMLRMLYCIQKRKFCLSPSHGLFYVRKPFVLLFQYSSFGGTYTSLFRIFDISHESVICLPRRSKNMSETT